MRESGRMLHQLLIGMSLFVFLVCVVGCGAPKWVEKGPQVFYEKEAKAIFGMGSAAGITNIPLAWETAENRARADLAKNFQTYLEYMMQDYARSQSSETPTASDESQIIKRVAQTVAAVTLHGAQPVDRYQDQDRGLYYALYKLDYGAMQEALQQGGQLSQELQEFIQQNGVRLLDLMNRQERATPPSS